MPTVSPAQQRFMQAVAHNPSFASKVGVPQSVGKEFVDSDPLDGLLQQLGFLQEWCDALNRRLDAWVNSRQDDDFKESEHPRDDDGKFATTGGGGSHPVHTLEGAAQHIDKLRARYPEADHSGKIRIKSDELLGEDSMGNHRGGDIHLSPKHWNEAGLEKFAKEWKGMNHDASPEGVLEHEFGHALHRKIEKILDPHTVNDIIYKWLNVAPNENLSIDGDQTSVYGQENMFEFMAESFVVHHSNGEKLSVAPGHPWHQKIRDTGIGVWTELLKEARGERLPKTAASARYIAGEYDLSGYTPARLRAAQALLEGSAQRGDAKHRTRLKKELAGRA